MAAGPFSGVLVLDLTRVLAGPYCTMLLSDLGARVVKIERPPHGDDARAFAPFKDGLSLYFACLNRGKESILLDLKADSDRHLFLRMVRSADVLVENFRPGTMEALGFGYDQLREVNSRLVFASVSGYGQTGPMSREPAYDTVIQAASGLMAITGEPGGAPTRVGVSIADLAGGSHTFGAIAAALFARERSGQGCRVDVALFDSVFSLLEHAVMEYVATGEEPRRVGNRHPTIAPFDTYAAADRALVICAGNNALFAKLCGVLGRPELATDPRFMTNAARLANETAMKAAIETALQTAPATVWLTRLKAAGVPCGPIRTVMEAVGDPQVAARTMLVDAAGVPLPGCPLKISGFADEPTRRPAPSLDVDGIRLRNEFGA